MIYLNGGTLGLASDLSHHHFGCSFFYKVMVILKFLKHKDTCRVDELLKQLIDKIN